MIEGIEGFHVELGVDDVSETGDAVDYTGPVDWEDDTTRVTATNRGDGVPDGDYVSCTTADPCTAAELMNVTAVKLYVLVRSRDESRNYTDSKTYNLGAVEHSGPTTTTSSATSSPRWCACRTSPAGGSRHDPRNPTASGAALVVGLIMLMLITLMLITALNMSTTNFRSVSNMQFRDEAIAAANKAIEQVVANNDFTDAPTAEEILVDTDNDGTNDYDVDWRAPVCVSATQANQPVYSDESLGPTMSVSSNWNTVWELDAKVTDAAGTGAHRARACRRPRIAVLDRERPPSATDDGASGVNDESHFLG